MYFFFNYFLSDLHDNTSSTKLTQLINIFTFKLYIGPRPSERQQVSPV